MRVERDLRKLAGGIDEWFGAVEFATSAGTKAFHDHWSFFLGEIALPFGVSALCGGLALLLGEGFQRTVLPVGRRGTARASLEGDLRRQIQHAELEPGVRRQL